MQENEEAPEVAVAPPRRHRRAKWLGTACLLLAAVAAAVLLWAWPAKDPGPRMPDVQNIGTPAAVVEKMLDMAAVTDQDMVYDLGCGDGRILIAAAKRGARARGFDIDPERVRESRENIKRAGLEHLATVEEADMFTVDLRPATVLTLYLLPRLNSRLVPQIEKMNPGSRIVSHGFDMQPYVPEKLDTAKGWLPQHNVYLWRTPLVRAAEPST